MIKLLGKNLKREFEKWFKGKNKKEVINFLISLIVILALLLFFYNTIFSNSSTKRDNVLFVNNNDQNITTEMQGASSTENVFADEIRLQNILTHIDGVGKVDVMITYESSKEVVPAIDLQETTESREERNSDGSIVFDNSKDSTQNIVTVNNNDLVILKEIKPKVKGVIIVAEGADSLIIKNNIINAAAAVFDISVDKIVVFQRKQ